MIETPSTDVVDLGTEFGVDVDESGGTDVVVFEGAVDLAYHAAEVASVSQGENPKAELACVLRNDARAGCRPAGGVLHFAGEREGIELGVTDLPPVIGMIPGRLVRRGRGLRLARVPVWAISGRIPPSQSESAIGSRNN